MPAASAGLLRFFEEETQGIKVRPELVVILAVTLILAAIFAKIFFPMGWNVRAIIFENIFIFSFSATFAAQEAVSGVRNHTAENGLFPFVQNFDALNTF